MMTSRRIVRAALLAAPAAILSPLAAFAAYPNEPSAAFPPGQARQDSLAAGSRERSPAVATIRAVRAPHPPTIDAVLDEPFWHDIEPVTDFRQRVPVDGAPSSERTELRVAFDDNNLYFAVVLHDSDPDGIRRSILHREGRIDQDDNIRIGLDTYNDKRNAYIFEINPFGTQGDALITDESMTLSDWWWEGVYESEGRVTDEGWVVEAAVPFTTIRFAEAEAPEMGILVERTIRRKNEMVYFPHIGQEFRQGLTQVSQYATLTGLEGLRRGRYMEMKPFAIAGRSVIGARGAAGRETETLNDLGLDFKYSITSNLTLDATLNPDFAQVESDNVQINLTRFSLFFPEKREFFLERAGLFDFGDAEETQVFFSRRIGITNDIVGGGRLTGQAGPVSVGALSLYTGDATSPFGGTRPGGLNSVLRLRADPFPRTTVGMIVTSLDKDARSNRVVGGDAQIRFGGSSFVRGWVARSSIQVDGSAPSPAASATAGSVEADLRSSLVSAGAGYTRIPRDFNPALGFVRRSDMSRVTGALAVFPRFERSRWARQLLAVAYGERIAGLDGVDQGTVLLSRNMLTFQTGDRAMLNLRRRSENLQWAAGIQGRELPAGEYVFDRVELRFNTNDSRRFSGRGGLSAGEFWNGTRTELSSGLMWKTGPHLTLGGHYTFNDISLPVADGDFTTRLFVVTILGAVSRSLFANALVQYDDVSNVVQANVRINWIHTPGSDLFVVFDTGYLTGGLPDPRTERWQRRTGVVKLTYLKAF
ncbi:MAG: DUF5916 domain-containing protein [Gemmatimonadota bacterium]|nr:DUF5916 domain-containing protein [Gemmatimonadota bacterium]